MSWVVNFLICLYNGLQLSVMMPFQNQLKLQL